MDFSSLPKSQLAEIDLHGCLVEDAELDLIDFLESLPKTVRAVCVTHGYSHGTRIKNMVRKDFYHWRVADKRVELNPGVTWFLLK